MAHLDPVVYVCQSVLISHLFCVVVGVDLQGQDMNLSTRIRGIKWVGGSMLEVSPPVEDYTATMGRYSINLYAWGFSPTEIFVHHRDMKGSSKIAYNHRIDPRDYPNMKLRTFLRMVERQGGRHENQRCTMVRT